MALSGVKTPTTKLPDSDKFEGAQAQMAQRMVAWARNFRGIQAELWGRLRELWGSERYLQETEHTQADGGATWMKYLTQQEEREEVKS